MQLHFLLQSEAPPRLPKNAMLSIMPLQISQSHITFFQAHEDRRSPCVKAQAQPPPSQILLGSKQLGIFLPFVFPDSLPAEECPS